MESDVTLRDGVVYNLQRAAESRQEAEETVHAVLRTIHDNGLESAPLLVDLRQCENISSEARRVFADASADDRFERIGFVTESSLMRVTVNFVTRASGKAEKTRFFSSLDEAMAWLRS